MGGLFLYNKNIMKVIKAFFCIESKVNYYIGGEYKGSRTDLSDFLEPKKENKKLPITKKKAIKTK